MSVFAIQLEALADAVDRMTLFERSVQERLDEIDARMSRLHGTWAGLAAEEHRAAHARWMAGAQELRGAVATLHRIGATAHSNYSAAITANQRMWA
ncbi:MAG: WXG100 family type VII secretion target [Jatrophihabitantaceae bacterium]